MSPTKLEVELWLPRPRDEVFVFFSDARNLQQITPPWLDFQVLTPEPIVMRPGLRIDYRLRVHGIPIRWQSEISVWEPPYRFVDEQRRGPYAQWHHEHVFEERDGGTVCRDIVHYASRGGPFRPLVEGLFVKRDVDRIFRYRSETLRRLFPPRPTALAA